MAKNEDLDYLNLLPHCEALEVTECSLQLRVKHRCGTVHAYVVSFQVDNEHGLEQQLNQDLSVMVELMKERVQEGHLDIHGRRYAVTETTNTNSTEMTELFARLPVVVLPPKVNIKKIYKSDQEFFEEELKPYFTEEPVEPVEEPVVVVPTEVVPAPAVDPDEVVEKLLEEIPEPVVEPTKKKRGRRAKDEQPVEGSSEASR